MLDFLGRLSFALPRLIAPLLLCCICLTARAQPDGDGVPVFDLPFGTGGTEANETDGADNGGGVPTPEKADNPVNPFATGSDAAESGGILARAWEKTRLTFLHELGYETGDSTEVAINRTSLRLRWDSLFAEHYYVYFDGKTRAHFSDDRKTLLEADDGVLYKDYVQEFYVQASWGETSVTVGKQKIAWGESDIAVVTDIFSPRDIEDFLFTSLDQARIGQTLFKLDRFADSGQWTLLVNPDPKTDTTLIVDGDETTTVDLSGFQINEQDPDDIDTEYGLRWGRPIGSGDFSIMLADVASNQPIFFFEGFSGATPVLSKEYPRYRMLGAAANIALSAYTLGIEAAYKQGFSFQVEGPYSVIDNNGVIERDRVETAISLQYTGAGNQSFLIGVSNQHMSDWRPDIIAIERNMNDITFNWSNRYLYDTLALSYVYKQQIEDENKIHNIKVEYSVTDNLYLSADLYALSTSDPVRFPYLDDDVAIFRVEYNF